MSGKTVLLDNDIPMVSAGAVVHHIGFGDGQVVALTASFPEHSKIIQFPYLKGVPDEITFIQTERRCFMKYLERELLVLIKLFSKGISWICHIHRNF